MVCTPCMTDTLEPIASWRSSAVLTLPWPRRRALWRGFMQACNDTEQVASMNGMDAAGAQLDWFGVPVKAAEIPVWTARMKMLARKVCRPHPALLP